MAFVPVSVWVVHNQGVYGCVCGRGVNRVLCHHLQVIHHSATMSKVEVKTKHTPQYIVYSGELSKKLLQGDLEEVH